MAAKFNSPPGWPTPPEGWTPPPGWSPDPSWPAAPEGWQFWVDDGAAGAAEAAAPPAYDPHATQTLGTAPTQALPTSSSQGMYSYGPSSGLEQPGASPYGSPAQAQAGGFQGGYPGQGGYPAAGGPPPKRRNTGAIIAICVVAALVLGGVIWGVASLMSPNDPDPTVAPTTTEAPTTDPATTDPATTDPATTDPATTDPATTDPATDPASGDVIDLVGDEPAIAVGSAGDPIAELRLAEIVPDWQPGANSIMCGEPENDQYLGLRFDITTLPALANEDPPTYTFIGWEIGAEMDGAALDVNGFGSGLFCLDSSEQAPSEMQPDQSYSGWVLLDVPANVTAVTYENFLDFTGAGNSYRWVLADQ